jgi:hypothetical protein
MLGVCPVTIEPYQVKVYMQARKTGATQAQASAIAGISERSGQRIDAGVHPWSEDAPEIGAPAQTR